MVIRQRALALLAGAIFGAGLAVSGMADPTRVRGFLALGPGWDPTLAFVMAGALLPMAAAWSLRRRFAQPMAASRFHTPNTLPITARLVIGSVLFGVGWGLSGLCPGPAIADLAIAPRMVMPFVLAMLTGFGLHRLVMPYPPSTGA